MPTCCPHVGHMFIESRFYALPTIPPTPTSPHPTPPHTNPRHPIPSHNHTTPHHTTSRHATPRHATPHHTTPHHSHSRLTSPHLTSPHPTSPHPASPCPALPELLEIRFDAGLPSSACANSPAYPLPAEPAFPGGLCVSPLACPSQPNRAHFA